MMNKKWVAIDKKFALTFKEIRREYSKIEAIYSLSLDINCNKKRSLRAYSRMWSWSIGKVKRFILSVKKNGTATEQQRNSNGTVYSLILLTKKEETEQQRNSNGTATEHEYKEQKQEEHIRQPVKIKKEKNFNKKIPLCPHSDIIKKYNEILGGKYLPAVKENLWDGTRKKDLTARWREDHERQSLKWWSDFFYSIRKMPFLIHGSNGSKWRATLGWMLRKANMTKILEGNYKAEEKSEWI